jgi:hypothetical protein
MNHHRVLFPLLLLLVLAGAGCKEESKDDSKKPPATGKKQAVVSGSGNDLLFLQEGVDPLDATVSVLETKVRIFQAHEKGCEQILSELMAFNHKHQKRLQEIDAAGKAASEKMSKEESKAFASRLVPIMGQAQKTKKILREKCPGQHEIVFRAFLHSNIVAGKEPLPSDPVLAGMITYLRASTKVLKENMGDCNKLSAAWDAFSRNNTEERLKLVAEFEKKLEGMKPEELVETVKEFMGYLMKDMLDFKKTSDAIREKCPEIVEKAENAFGGSKIESIIKSKLEAVTDEEIKSVP